MSDIHSVPESAVILSCSVPEQYQRQPAPVTAPHCSMIPYGKGYRSPFPVPMGEGKEMVCEEDKGERGILPFTTGQATRLYTDTSFDGMRVTVAQTYVKVQDLQWRSVYEINRAQTTCEEKNSNMEQDRAALLHGIISSQKYLREVKFQAVMTFKPMIFNGIKAPNVVMHRSVLKATEYDISFLIYGHNLSFVIETRALPSSPRLALVRDTRRQFPT